MRKFIVAALLAGLPTACIVSTDTIEGRQGDAGPPGNDGAPGKNGTPGKDGMPGMNGSDGVSPFSYVDPKTKTDIYYGGGNVGIGGQPDSLLDVVTHGGPDVTAFTLGTINNSGVNNGDILRLLWRSANPNDSGKYNIASISAILKAGNFGVGGELAFYTKQDGSNTDPIERVRVSRDGNVGIGTDNPTAKLHVKDGFIHARLESDIGNGDIPLMFTNSADAQTWQLRYFGAFKGMAMYHDDAPQYVTTWLPNGNVGIGTPNPTGMLHIKSSSPQQSPVILSENDVGDATYLYTARSAFQIAAGKTVLENVNNHQVLINPSAGGNVGIGTFSPVATLDVNGTARLAKYAAPPFGCDPAHDGTIALTNQYTMCVCKMGNPNNWVQTSNGTTPCVWQ